jgi:hypothetical protein
VHAASRNKRADNKIRLTRLVFISTPIRESVSFSSRKFLTSVPSIQNTHRARWPVLRAAEGLLSPGALRFSCRAIGGSSILTLAVRSSIDGIRRESHQ